MAFACALVALAPTTGVEQMSTTLTLASYNIQSGKGEPALPGCRSPFPDTANCTDITKPRAIGIAAGLPTRPMPL